MAVVKQPFTSSFKLRYQAGVNAKGDPVYINQSFSKVKVTATDQDVFDVANAINSLQTRALVAIYRADDSELVTSKQC